MVKSDNGLQYSSAEFATFATCWKFAHVTSSPKYPQSNGLAEKTVQTAKKMLEKAKRDQKDPYLSLLEKRNTPVANYKSPAQLSMGRPLRSILPCTTNQLIPEKVCYRETQTRLQKKQAEQKSYYDKSSVQSLRPLKTGESVRVKQQGEWRPAKVIEISDTPRSYLVKTSDGGVYRRNRRHLHKDTLQDQFDQYAEVSTEVNQPSGEQKQQSESVEDQQQKPSNTEIVGDGYRTNSGRLVKAPERY